MYQPTVALFSCAVAALYEPSVYEKFFRKVSQSGVSSIENRYPNLAPAYKRWLRITEVVSAAAIPIFLSYLVISPSFPLPMIYKILVPGAALLGRRLYQYVHLHLNSKKALDSHLIDKEVESVNRRVVQNEPLTCRQEKRVLISNLIGGGLISLSAFLIQRLKSMPGSLPLLLSYGLPTLSLLPMVLIKNSKDYQSDLQDKKPFYLKVGIISELAIRTLSIWVFSQVLVEGSLKSYLFTLGIFEAFRSVNKDSKSSFRKQFVMDS